MATLQRSYLAQVQHIIWKKQEGAALLQKFFGISFCLTAGYTGFLLGRRIVPGVAAAQV